MVKKSKLHFDEIIGILLFIVSFVMLGISVYLCGSSDIWYDEMFTMGFAGQSAAELISSTARDVHPPLYYLVVHLFVKLAGASFEKQVFMAKLASVVPFFLCMLLSAVKVRKYFGIFTAGLFSFLVISMPQMAAYTVEIRMYGYALLFVTAAMLYAYEIVWEKREKKQASLWKWAGLTVCGICACYTHYFACVAACMVYLYLGVCLFSKMKREKRGAGIWKGFLISSACCALAYLPWLITVVISQVGKVSEEYWIQPVSLRTLGGCVKFIFKPQFTNETINTVLAVCFFILYVLLFMGAVVSCFQKKKSREGKEKSDGREVGFLAGCLGILGGVVLFGMAASILIKPIFVYRYMIPAMGVFWLAFAILAGRWKEKKAVLTILLLFVGIIGISNFRAFYGDEMWKKVQMEQAKEALLQIGEEDVLLFNFDQTQAVVSCYLDNESYLWYGEPEKLVKEMYPENHALVEGDFSDEAGIEKIRELLAENETVWFLGSGNAREEILAKWEECGIASKEEKSVLIERYWFNLYSITNY